MVPTLLVCPRNVTFSFSSVELPTLSGRRTMICDNVGSEDITLTDSTWSDCTAPKSLPRSASQPMHPRPMCPLLERHKQSLFMHPHSNRFTICINFATLTL